jgi:hypothetical protein
MASLSSVSSLVSKDLLDNTVEGLDAFPKFWDQAAELFEHTQQNAIERILSPIQAGMSDAFLTALTEITKTNLVFIEEACGIYEQHVKAQLQYMNRTGYKKLNLQALLHLRRLLDPIKTRLNQRLDFEALKAEIQALSDALTQITQEAEEAGFNKGKFALLIEEITRHLHPLLRLKERNERFVRDFISTLSEEPAPATEQSEALCAELSSQTLRALREELSSAKKFLKQAIDDNDSTSLIQAKFFLGSFIRKAKGMSNQLKAAISASQAAVQSPEKTLKESTKSAFTESLRAAKNNYEERINAIIKDYRRAVRSQFLWFFRDGYTKLKLLQAAVSGGNVNLQTLQTALLNQGKCASVVQKLRETAAQKDSLSTFSTPIEESSPVRQTISLEDQMASHQFKGQYAIALDWLDKTILEAESVDWSLDSALKTLISEESEAASPSAGVEESKGEEPEASPQRFTPPPQPSRSGNPFRAFMGPTLPRFTAEAAGAQASEEKAAEHL